MNIVIKSSPDVLSFVMLMLSNDGLNSVEALMYNSSAITKKRTVLLTLPFNREKIAPSMRKKDISKDIVAKSFNIALLLSVVGLALIRSEHALSKSLDV